MTVAHKIVGTSTQMVICQLDPGQTIYAEAGRFLWKTVNVTLETRLSRPAPGDSGSRLVDLAKEVGKRVLAGQSLALQYFRASGGSGLVGFAGTLPGELRAIELDGSQGWFTERASMLAAEGDVEMDIAFTGMRTGRRGGSGFILEKFTGQGTLLIAAAGNLLEVDPSKYGGKIQVHPGGLVAFQDSIRYGVEHVGGLTTQTAMTAAFGGQGINLATLEGEGVVLLQSVNLHGLAETLQKIAGEGDGKVIGGVPGVVN